MSTSQDTVSQPMPSMDIMFQTAYRQIVNDGTVEKMVRVGVEKLVQESIASSLRYGPLAQSLKDQVEASLKVASLDLPSYGETIGQIIRKMVEAATADSIQRGIGEKITELLQTPPESIKVSELIEQFRKMVEDSHDEGCHCGEIKPIGVKFDGDYGFKHLYLSEEEHDHKKNKYDSDIQIDCDKDGKIYNLRIRDGNVRNMLFVGRGVYNFERFLVQCYASGTKIIFDCDPMDCDRDIYPEH
jgi:hypothetical protein